MTQNDPKLPPGTRLCRCSVCRLYFNSVKPFDMHRVGPWEQRRCLSEDEMRELGMTLNRKGYWISRPMGEAKP